jgi:hypothetical protein
MKFMEKGGRGAVFSSVIALGLSFYLGYAIALNKYESMMGDKALARFMTEFSALKYLEMDNDVEGNAKKMLVLSLEANLVDLCEHEPSDVEEIYQKQQKKLFVKFAELRKIYPPTNYGDEGLFNHRVDLCLKQVLGIVKLGSDSILFDRLTPSQQPASVAWATVGWR